MAAAIQAEVAEAAGTGGGDGGAMANAEIDVAASTALVVEITLVVEIPDPLPPASAAPTSTPQDLAAHGLPRTDYMAMLGDECAGKRQAFMAENRMYYMPGWDVSDKLGLPHPFPPRDQFE